MWVGQLFDPDKLKHHVRQGRISAQRHSKLPLTVYKYTNQTVFDDAWDEVTETCRGLILSDAGEVIARPFRKFFNLNTAKRPETMWDNLPRFSPHITEKLDGSLGIRWEYEGQVGIATVGSFQSEQASWATAWYHQERARQYCWPAGFTILFEIIYKENRIVVDYPFEGLVLLGAVSIGTGQELSYPILSTLARENDVRLVRWVPKPVEECILENNRNEEGYVLAWHSSDAPPLRVKVKFHDYCRLHRLVTGVSPISVWEILREGQPLNLILDNDAPKSYCTWVNEWRGRLETQFAQIEKECQLIFEQFRSITNGQFTRKEAALQFTKTPQLASVLFAILDGKDYRDIIWKKIRPKAEKSAFRQEETKSHLN